MLKEQILALAWRYLERGIDRSAFSEQFARLYVEVRNNRSARLDARNLCSAIILPFAELSRGDRNEASFRQGLENAIRPFVHPEVHARVYARPIEIEVGTPRYRATSAESLEVSAVA